MDNKPNRPLFVPVEFWSEVMLNLDKRVQAITEGFGYGEVAMNIKIHKEKILEVEFTDHVRVRGIVAKAGQRGNDLSPQGTDSTLVQAPTSPTSQAKTFNSTK